MDMDFPATVGIVILESKVVDIIIAIVEEVLEIVEVAIPVTIFIFIFILVQSVVSNEVEYEGVVEPDATENRWDQHSYCSWRTVIHKCHE